MPVSACETLLAPVVRFVLLVVLLGLLAAGDPVHADSPPKIALTPAERAWIKSHPVVRVAAEADWRPLEYMEGRRHAGLSAEYLAAVTRLTGLRFQIEPRRGVQDIRNALEARQVDMLSAVPRTYTEEALGDRILVTAPYVAGVTVAVTRDSETVTFDTRALEGKKIALRGGTALEHELRTWHPDIELITAPSTDEALELVANGSADAAIGMDTAVLPVLRRKYYGRLHMSGTLADLAVEIGMGVRKDLPILASIINKALMSLTARETDAMVEKWLEGTDYGQPSPRTVLHYYGPQVALLAAILLVLSASTYFALRARKIARRSERDKAMFLAIMGHEIRTPMHAILSSVELLQRSDLDGRQARLTDVAVAAGENLLALLDDILDYSKIEAGEVKLELMPTPLYHWVQEAVEMMRWRAEAQGLTLALEYQCDPALTLEIGPTRLRQVLLNLLSNAIKFTARGSVRVQVRFNAAENAGRDELTIEVHDTGIGIAPHQQEHIFEAFKQANIGTTRQFGGTGLGLTICRQLVRLMDGSISMCSEPGAFSTFTVVIPVKRVEPVEATGEDWRADRDRMTSYVRVERKAGPQILVVDDHELARFMTGQQLNSLGRSVAYADSGEAALALVAEHCHDLMLLDCDLPGMDGYSVAKEIRAAEAGTGRHLPIIALSASTDQKHQTRCLASGMDGVLTKPVRLKDLRKMLDLWCSASQGSKAVQTGEQPADLTALYAHYAHSLDVEIAAIEEAISMRDLPMMRHAAHRIKGAALIMGHHSIAEIASEIEDLIYSDADGERVEEVDCLLELLKAAVIQQRMDPCSSLIPARPVDLLPH